MYIKFSVGKTYAQKVSCVEYRRFTKRTLDGARERRQNAYGSEINRERL